MDEKENIKDLTPEKLGEYATDILARRNPLNTLVDDYSLNPIVKELIEVSNNNCKEAVRYANYLAEKEGLGKNYFDPEKARKMLLEFTDKKYSDLEKKLNNNGCAAA